MKFTFQTPTRLIFGSGRLDALGDEKLPGKKALLLTSRGKSAERTGALERTMKALERAGAQYVYCPMVESNPVVNNVMKAAPAARFATAAIFLTAARSTLCSPRRARTSSACR